MTKDDIAEIAKQAGLEEAYSLQHNQVLVRYKDGALEAFAKLVAAKATEEANVRSNASWSKMCKVMVEQEREACLEIADQCADADMHASMVANTIRARGENQ